MLVEEQAAQAAPRGVERWSVKAAPGPLAVAEWTDILAATHVRFDVRYTQCTPPTFYGAVTRRRFGDLALVDCAASPFLGRRSAACTADSPKSESVFGLQFVRRGVEHVRDGTRELRLKAGDVILWDSEMPVEVEVVEPFVKRTVIFTRERLLGICPQLEDLDTRPLLATSAAGRLLARYLDALALELADLDDAGKTAAADAALELLRAALAPSLPSRRAARRAALGAAVRQHIRANLRDVSLGPETIAREHAMSVRALHALFEGGESVGALIRRERLARCHSDLCAADGGSVTEIAFRWGFHDAAHFARVFKQHFHATPSEVRREAQRTVVARSRGSQRDEGA